MDAIIRTEKLKYSYDSEDAGVLRLALDGVDLEIERGSFTAILGHNGSGKSTLARHFNGIFLPLEGAVLVDGMNTADEEKLYEIRRKIGMVFQNPDNQIVASVVDEDVAFAPENLGLPREEIIRRVDSSLASVGMEEFRGHAPHLLSGGQKQRVAIAGVLAMRPECIVLDEPTAMLDPKGREEVLSTVTQLRKEYGMTVVIITHHMSEAARADRVVVLAKGKIHLDGTPREVLTNVEGLSEVGLEAPPSVRLILALRERGAHIPEIPLNDEECAAALCRWLASGKEGE
ncbi:MAG: energy-coupling factor transporter ATPase [Ruminococcaceae bacterium]|nr:energy-coupling factor transporter ATPase [Oscillospiraceae bacterium]